MNVARGLFTFCLRIGYLNFTVILKIRSKIMLITDRFSIFDCSFFHILVTFEQLDFSLMFTHKTSCLLQFSPIFNSRLYYMSC